MAFRVLEGFVYSFIVQIFTVDIMSLSVLHTEGEHEEDIGSVCKKRLRETDLWSNFLWLSYVPNHEFKGSWVGGAHL